MPVPNTPSSETPSPTLPASGTYRLDPARSSTSFTTRHLFGLAKVTGSLAVIDGQVTVATDPAASTVIATIAADSFESASAGRDKVVKSRGYLDVDNHPQITFASTAVAQDGQTWLVRGSLTARGVASPIELTITDIVENHDEVTVRATATIDRYAHGLTKAKGLAARRLHLQLIATATRI